MPISTIGSNSLNQTSDLTINGVTVGKGAGSDSTSTAVGSGALATSGGSTNTAIGFYALNVNSSGTANTSIGRNTLLANTSGTSNVAVGHQALTANTTASNNTAVGYQALYSGTTAAFSTAVGYQAGYAATASYNTMFGAGAGSGASFTGNENTLVGYYAGNALTSGSKNTFVGPAFGNGCGGLITTGGSNTVIGGYSGNAGGVDIRTLSNFIVLSDGDGNPRMVYEGDNNVWSAPQIYNSTTGSGANVHVGTTGRLYRSTSSLKYKTNVQAATFGLADVLKLRAVTYQGNGLDDGSKTYAGLIAEEVHDAGLTEFVQYAEDGTPDALAYGNMVSLLVKAIQELKTIVDAQAAEIAELKAKVA